MIVCSCCYDPVVYPEKLGMGWIPSQIIIHDDVPTFEGEPDWTHRFTTRISHEVLERCGMQYHGALGDEDNKMWHLPDGRVVSVGAGNSGVSFCLIHRGCVETLSRK